ARTTGIPIDRVRCRCWQRVDRVLGQLDARHIRNSRQGGPPALQICSTRNEITGTTVTVHLHWRKRNQRVMNQQLSTSISGKPITENLVGEGWGEGSRSIVRAKT